MSSITNREIIDFQNRCRAHACKTKRPHLADDFAQEAVIRWLHSGYSNIDHLYIDFIRKELGRKGTAYGDIKSSACHGMKSLQDLIPGSTLTIEETITAPNQEVENFYSRRTMLDATIGMRDSIIARMLFDGLKELEIADIFGITESRVSQIKRKISKAGEEINTLEKVYDLYTDDKEYSKLSINWITL